MQKEIANKPNVMAAQRKLLETRYILDPKLDPQAKMSRGKALPVGPTARLQAGMTWQQIGNLGPEEIKQRGIFPYPSCRIPCRPMAVKSSLRCRSTCFRVWNVSMLTSIFRTRSSRVPSGYLPKQSATTGRCVSRRSGLDQQFLPIVQRAAHTCTTRRAAVSFNAVPAGGI